MPPKLRRPLRRAPRGRSSTPRPSRLVFELGTEELPPTAAWDGAAQIREAAPLALRAARIPCGAVAAYSTPRRIVLVVEDVAPRQEDLVREVRGPAARVAYAPDGNPTKAAEGFARGQGLPVEALERRTTPQGEYVYAVLRSPGGPTGQALREVLPALAAGLTFPRPMRWGPEGVRFARPVRWVLALLGRQVIPCRFADVEAGRRTYGHRVLSPRAFPVAEASGFESTLRKHFVMLDPADRRERIAEAAARVATQVGGRPILDSELLEETVQLVEWPEALVGRFAPEFLALPREVLITVMQHHQKYFAVEDARGQLLPNFVALRNGGTRGLETVRQGNEWVLRARLADARFFFAEDRKRPLSARVPELTGLVVHERLGTMREKTDRLVRLAGRLAAALAIPGERGLALERAALLSKADLVTQVVRELPELQGVIGSIYARLDGEPAAVAEALREQYLPRGAQLPQSELGADLALLDKLDTLLSGLAAGLAASGSQDPYGLRRAAAGIVAIVLDRHLRLDLREFSRAALEDLTPALDPARRAAALDGVMDLLRQRLRTVLIEGGISYDTADAVLEAGAADPADAAARARALWAFRKRAEFARLYTAFDRAARIVPGDFQGRVHAEALQVDAERSLLAAIEALESPGAAASADLGPAETVRHYEQSFRRLAALGDPVDRFFTDVLVMAEDGTARANRLALLARVVGLVRPLADLTRVVVGEGKASPDS
ncbi:MAG TPA: glycine--tRNA ligase subunit beta [bacterium]|nr:glycine--tRNA ligase subunit beta [bacterium]